MNPIWTFSKEVGRHLPGGRRTMLTGAIHARLTGRLKALETSLGRKATEAEVREMLRAEGDPADVAKRYGDPPGQSDLVTRYIASIQRRLPPEQAIDTIAELREALADRIAAKEDTLGRTATGDEIADVIKAFGAPAVVAARYEGRMNLIGPVLYPWFWPAQRAAVGMTAAIVIVLAAIRALASDAPIRAVFQSIDNIIGWGLAAFAVVTLVFIAVERTSDPAKLAEKWWNPKHLPREEIRAPRSLFEAGISLFFDTLFILFWLKVMPFPNELPLRDGASVSVVLSPAWAAVYWPVLGLALLAAASHVSDMVRPAWSRWRSMVRIAGYTAGLVVLWVLFRARPLVEIMPRPETSAEELERALRMVDGLVTVSLGAAALIWSITIGVEVWRQMKAARVTGGTAPLAA